jgi:hypothetical protein
MRYIKYYRYGATKPYLVEVGYANGWNPGGWFPGLVIFNNITMADWDGFFSGRNPDGCIKLNLNYTYYEHAHEIRYWSIEQAHKPRHRPDISKLNIDQKSEYVIYKKFCKERGMTKDILQNFTYEGFAISL